MNGKRASRPVPVRIFLGDQRGHRPIIGGKLRIVHGQQSRCERVVAVMEMMIVETFRAVAGLDADQCFPVADSR